MSQRELEVTQHTAEPEPEQDPKGSPTLQAKVDPDTRREVERSLEAFGFDSLAEGVRLVMKSFARSEKVRQAVRESLHLAVLDAPSGATR